MMLFSTSFLLTVLSLETVLSSPATLLPLERQRKSLQEDIAFFLPDDSANTPFRARQSSLKSVATPSKRSTLPSVFSERQHLIEAKNMAEDFKRKRLSAASPHRAHRSDQERWDPWFPALPQDKKRFETDSERDAINSALKHMAWERLNKRLIQLHGQQGPYLDRGERRTRRIKKRASSRTSSNTKKELEAILSDDVGEQPKHDPAEKSSNNDSKTENRKAQVVLRQNMPKGPKGKQWMPLDSEPTLRSKKSWDEYFGVDKRDSRALPLAESSESVENGELIDDEGSDQELKDYLVQWYFNKMLQHLSPSQAQRMANSEEFKKKKKKNAKLIEDDIIIKNADDGKNIDLSDGIPFEEVDERLRTIEDWLLSEATKIIETGMNGNEKGPKDAGTAGVEEPESDLMDHLKAAYSLDRMRDALGEFREAFDKIKRQEAALERAANGQFEDDMDKKKKKRRLDEDDDDDDNFDKKKKKSVSKKNIAEGRSSNQIPNEKIWTKTTGLSKSDLTNEVASPVFAPEPQGDHNLPCPVMTASLGYCEELSDALGEMGQMLARPCVEHMICYTCDDTPSVCNVAFLQDAAELCEDDFRCQAIAGAMRSVFLADHDKFRFKHEGLCDVDQCLLQLQQWN